MKVFIALPAFGHVNSSHTTGSIVDVTSELAKRNWFGGFSALSFPDLEDLRAMFLTLWFDHIDATHMLMVDADMRFEASLVLDMIAADKPLVGCVYRTRSTPGKWVGSALEGPQVPENGFLKMEGVGFGVTLIRKDCVQAMLDKGNVEIRTNLDQSSAGQWLSANGAKRIIRAFDKVTTPDGRELSEDFSFCHRHREAGGDVWAAVNHTIIHVGDYGYTGNYANDVLKTGKGPVSVRFNSSA